MKVVDTLDSYIDDNVVAFCGIKLITSSAIDKAYYAEWTKANPGLHRELLTKMLPRDWEKLNGKSLPGYVISGIHREIGTNEEAIALKSYEDTLKEEDHDEPGGRQVTVVSDQKDRMVNVTSSTPLRIVGHVDGLVYSGSKCVGLVEVKTRMQCFSENDYDVAQLTCYSRMVPNLEEYVLLERLHITGEMRATVYSYDELTPKWEEICEGLRKVQPLIIAKYKEMVQAQSTAPAVYKEEVLGLLDHLTKILLALSDRGYTPVAMGPEILKTIYQEADKTEAATMYEMLTSTATPILKGRAKDRDIKYFLDNITTIIKGQPIEKDSRLRPMIESLANVITDKKLLTDNTRDRVWARIDKILSLI